MSARDLRLVAALVAAGILALVFLKIGNEISEGETECARRSSVAGSFRPILGRTVTAAEQLLGTPRRV